MQLIVSSDDIARALRDDCARFVGVGLMEKAAAWINVAPEIERGATTHFPEARNQRFGVKRFGQVVAPANRVERGEQVRHEGTSCALADVAAGLREDLERNRRR